MKGKTEDYTKQNIDTILQAMQVISDDYQTRYYTNYMNELIGRIDETGSRPVHPALRGKADKEIVTINPIGDYQGICMEQWEEIEAYMLQVAKRTGYTMKVTIELD